MVTTYQLERDVKMAIGDTTEAGGYVFALRGLKEIKGPNYDGLQGQVEVTRDGKAVALLRPEKRIYRVQRNPMTEADIDRGITRDLYVSLGEPTPDGSWIVRVYFKPFVNWIWGGCVLMALGGALAASDRRYRAKQRQEQAQQVGPAGAVA
jgi:cytochrome c-type biogenesis protein CcmF